MKKIISFWLCSLFVLGFQTFVYSQNNTSLPATANPNNLGNNNTAIGHDSMRNITTGNFNIALGSKSLRYNGGVSNIAIGFRALDTIAFGNHNTAIGYYALGNLTSSSTGNIALGSNAGNNVINGNNNIFIGNGVRPNAYQNQVNNQLFIGFGESNFPLIRGDVSTIRQLTINLRNSTSNGSGESRFQINAPLNNMSGLRFTRLNGNFVPPISTNDRFLTVKNDGDVVLLRLPVGNGGGSFDTNIYNDNGNLSSDRYMNMNNFNLHFDTSTSATGNGRIYIGSNNNLPPVSIPNSNYRLLVEGGILTEKVKVALEGTTNWADYVFADDYQLKSLKEVEAFIKENKHLPGIESAQELVENGLDLGEMQAKQMGEI